MHVGVLTTRFPVRSQTFVVDHAAALLRRGHDVTVLPINSLPLWDDPPRHVRDVVQATVPSPAGRVVSRNPFEGAGIAVRALARGRYTNVRFALERDGAPRGLRHRLLLAERAARSGPFDVLHAQFAWTGPAAIALARRGIVGAPVVCSIHGQDANVTGREHPGWLAAIARQVALMTVGSTFMRGVVEAQGVPADKVRLWPQGVDVDRDVAHVPARDGEFRVLSVGRLVEFKGVDDSLRVIAKARARIPGLRYTVIGEGELREPLERLAAELGVRDIVTFAGGGNHAEVLAAHATTDLFLQMGKVAADGSTEGQGVAPCEASASGIACVATRSGGLTDVIRHEETGLLVDSGDVDAGADAVVRLAGDPALRARLGEAGRAYMRARYSIAATSGRIEEIYREALG